MFQEGLPILVQFLPPSLSLIRLFCRNNSLGFLLKPPGNIIPPSFKTLHFVLPLLELLIITPFSFPHTFTLTWLTFSRVRSDKFRTGIIIIVPVRTASVIFLKKTGNFPTKHFVRYKLEKVNFLVIL